MRHQVMIVEQRELLFEVEADSPEQAQEIAMDMDATEAVRDSFRERNHDWCAPV